jgi:drug/metabolite transporter (DMT)-like permease
MQESLILIISLIVITSICDTISQLLLKTSVNSINDLSVNRIKILIKFILRLIRTPKVWLGLFFSTLSLCIWLIVLSRADLNFAFSVDSMHYIFIAFASGLILKERIGFLRWMGTILIVVGIILVTLS